jgi:hypothetical protein
VYIPIFIVLVLLGQFSVFLALRGCWGGSNTNTTKDRRLARTFSLILPSASPIPQCSRHDRKSQLPSQA